MRVSIICIICFSLVSALFSCSSTRELDVSPSFIANNNLPNKPLFQCDQQFEDYYGEQITDNTLNPYTPSNLKSFNTCSLISFNQPTYVNLFYGYNNFSPFYWVWYRPYNASCFPSGYYGNHYFSRYSNGNYWGTNPIAPTNNLGDFYAGSISELTPSTTYTNYMYTSSLGHQDRIKYMERIQSQQKTILEAITAVKPSIYSRPTQPKKTNTLVTFHLKKSTSYSYNSKSTSRKRTGYYQSSSNTPRVQTEYHNRTNTPSPTNHSSGGYHSTGNSNRSNSTTYQAPARTYSGKTSGGGSRTGGQSPNRQKAPSPSAVPRRN